jgi:U3 small nucleolar ribonucleoprotein protein IMP3
MLKKAKKVRRHTSRSVTGQPRGVGHQVNYWTPTNKRNKKAQNPPFLNRPLQHHLPPAVSNKMRQLKYHEKKLLRGVDFYSWKGEDNLRVAKIMRKYHLQKREDYIAYNRLVGHVTSLAAKLKTLPPADTFRIAMTDQLLTKIYNIGLIDKASSLQKAEDLTATQFCRRRLPVLMVRLKMAANMKVAITYVEQGQVRVGPDVVTDPAFLVCRNMEDYITWVDSSKIRRSVQKYNNKLDDFDLL